jgi:rod shape-determining protein MreD
MGTPWWLAGLLLLAAALIQGSLVPAMGFATIRPELVMQFVVIWAVMRGVREALPWAFFGGLLLDVLSGGPFGTAALALVLVAFCCSVGELSLFKSNLFLPLVAVFWGSVLYAVLYLFLLRTHQQPVDWLPTLRHVVVPNAFLDMLTAPFSYLLLSRIERRTRTTISVAV